MKCCLMRHFIWVLTVCQSTHSGVSISQRFFSFSKNSFRNTIIVSKCLGPDQDPSSVGSDLDPNCLQRISAVEKSVKQFGSRSGPTKLVLIWVQTVYKGYQQLQKVSNHLDPDKDRLSQSRSGSKLFAKVGLNIFYLINHFYINTIS